MQRFISLDAFRGIAAIGIVLVHLGFSVRPWWVPTADDLYLLVDFFFVLSGFVITHSYATRIQSGADMRVFMLRRVGRVWPLHAAMITAMLGFELLKLVTSATGLSTLLPFQAGAPLDHVVEHLLLLDSFGLTDGLSWNVPDWSISGEVIAYLIFGLVIYFAVPLHLAALAISLVSLAILAWLAPLNMAATYDFGALRCLAGFFTGCLALSLFRAMPKALTQGNVWVWTLVELVALASALVFLVVAGTTWLSLCAPFVFAACVLCFSSDAGLVSRGLSNAVFAFIGRISYSIYMVHFVLLRFIHAALEVLGEFLPSPAEMQFAFKADLLTLAFVGLTIGVSALTYRFIELPGIALFRTFEAARAEPRTVPAD